MRRLFADIHRHDIEAAVRVAAAVGLPLLALDAIGRLDLAVYAAFGGLAMLYGHSEPAKKRVESQVVAGAGLVVTMAIAMAWSASHAPLAVLGVLLALTVGAGVTLGSAMRWIPRGEMFFVLVLLIIAAIPTKWESLPLALVVGAGGAGFSVLLAAINAIGAPPDEEKPDGWRRRIASGYADLDRRQHLVVLAAATLGVLAAWSLALALGIGHPFWAAVTVAALMPALAAKDVWRRAIHLMLGTLGGVAIAGFLFSFEPGPLALIAIIVICQAVAEIAVSRNYGVALLFFCPLAIGMSNLSRGAPWPPILVDRVAEAALGVAVAFLTIFAGRRILKVT
ncbi:FUSC family protein [Reyranella sp.]|uniref:FUSC family protein n=1 Tax=Reyranella sp. TaxID=1929291 RepID=UPI003BAD16CF